MKKRKGKDSEEYYKNLGVSPEFCLSSRRPGIGLDYLNAHADQIWNKGYITLQGKRLPIPRYFMTKFKDMIPSYELVKNSHSVDMERKQWKKFNDLVVRFDDEEKASRYIWDSLQQSALNLEKRLELSKGALNA